MTDVIYVVFEVQLLCDCCGCAELVRSLGWFDTPREAMLHVERAQFDKRPTEAYVARIVTPLDVWPLEFSLGYDEFRVHKVERGTPPKDTP